MSLSVHIIPIVVDFSTLSTRTAPISKKKPFAHLSYSPSAIPIPKFRINFFCTFKYFYYTNSTKFSTMISTHQH